MSKRTSCGAAATCTGRIAPKVCHTLYAGKRESVSLPLERRIEILAQLILYRKYIFIS
jgi:hypothetical protein